MNAATQLRKAEVFRKLHDRSAIFVLPNAWDVASALIFARTGFAAVATTSGGVAWSLGHADGERIPRDEAVAAIARIAHALDVPVSADIEAGYGTTPDQVNETVRQVIAAGAVGINLEDSLADGTLRETGAAVDRIRAARAAADDAGIPIVINARSDAWLNGFVANERERFDETIHRARRYLEAGADCIYPIGLGDVATIAALVKELDAPVNVGARPGLPGVAELARLGVARISTATRFATLALSAIERVAVEIRDSGRFDCLGASLTHPDVQHLFDRG
ncbi:MAG: isocitrate lyase/phosphoenolpyruvate mutase family protein [Deltaproteobacteria bacterium]